MDTPITLEQINAELFKERGNLKAANHVYNMTKAPHDMDQALATVRVAEDKVKILEKMAADLQTYEKIETPIKVEVPNEEREL